MDMFVQYVDYSNEMFSLKQFIPVFGDIITKINQLQIMKHYGPEWNVTWHC